MRRDNQERVKPSVQGRMKIVLMSLVMLTSLMNRSCLEVEELEEMSYPSRLGFVVSELSNPTTEYGVSGTFSVQLKEQPHGEVEVVLESLNPEEAMVSPESLIFSPSDWDQSRSVRVTGVDDELADGDQ
ncbi:MAG: hypothetical protein HQM12_20290, partial [SAR324 cluster bacterium]|nr:hypothetical protein [SAR324 cluster bacterium]